jgi:hypothetical protein
MMAPTIALMGALLDVAERPVVESGPREDEDGKDVDATPFGFKFTVATCIGVPETLTEVVVNTAPPDVNVLVNVEV